MKTVKDFLETFICKAGESIHQLSDHEWEIQKWTARTFKTMGNVLAFSDYNTFPEFDSALDEKRKSTVFELYTKKLQRKLIILSPKAHEDEYYHQFSKAFIVSHDPKEVKSKIRGIEITG